MGQLASNLSATIYEHIAPRPPSPGVVRYHSVWVDDEGATHIERELQFSRLEEADYSASGTLQHVRKFTNQDFEVTDIVVTQQIGTDQWNHSPAPRFVVTLEGSWFIRTSDGAQVVMRPGDVLYQDNTSTHPGALDGTRNAKHYSGAIGGPCNQLIIQLETPLRTNKPGRWSDG